MEDPLFEQTVQKIADSGWQGEALIVSYFLPCDGHEQLCIGWLAEFCDLETERALNIGIRPDHPEDRFCWAFAPFQVTDNPNIVAGFCHEYQSFHDRISGYYPGGQTGGDEDEIKLRWAREQS